MVEELPGGRAERACPEGQGKEVAPMLLHMTHTHASKDCPAHNREFMKTFVGVLQSAEGKGVKIHSLYVAPWEHTFYGILEADSAESLEHWLDPLLELGSADITPVEDASLAAFERRVASA
jgi:hypothetical protein